MNRAIKRLSAMVLTGAMVAGMTAGAFAAADVAKIGSKGYKSLNDALANVKHGQTIVLQSDIYSSNESYDMGNGIVFLYDKDDKLDFTIDFNGKSIIADENTDAGMGIAVFGSSGALSVILKNGSIKATGKEVAGLGVMAGEELSGTNVTLDNMKISAEDEAGINCWNAKLVLKANVTGADDAVFAKDSDVIIKAGQYTATGKDSDDGVIATYRTTSEDEEELDLTLVHMPGSPAVIRPADWEEQKSMQLSVVNYDDVKLKDASKPDPWFFYDVYKMAELGIVSGDGNYWTFHPYNDVTREQFAQILASAAKADLNAYKGKTSFNDVKADRWSAPAIEWAYANKIVSGTGHGKYSPYAKIRRQEVCVMLDKYQAVIMNLEPIQKVEVGVYPDGDKVDTWAEKAMQHMLMQQVISGVRQKDGTVLLAPKGNTTRAQVCTMMRALLSLEEDQID